MSTAVAPTASAFERLRLVEDPELPVSIIDLGMVRGVAVAPHGHTVVTLVPTFLGCPAKHFIEAAVKEAVEGAEVQWSTDSWTLDDVNAEARERIRELGIAMPDASGKVRCAHCGSDELVIESEFGSTLCRKLAYCPSCQTPSEVLKGPSATPVELRRKADRELHTT